MTMLRVLANSKPNAIAGAIAGTIRKEGKTEVQVIGAGALNQAIKAIAIARGYVAPSGIDLVCVPAFVDVSIGEVKKTAIKLIIGPRR
jgi:stage V sporulation protein S